jgi:hypothetical protein
MDKKQGSLSTADVVKQIIACISSSYNRNHPKCCQRRTRLASIKTLKMYKGAFQTVEDLFRISAIIYTKQDPN